MTTSNNQEVLVAYSYDDWITLGKATPIYVNMGLNHNSHTLISGMSGSGKSYFTKQYLARLFQTGGDNTTIYLADYKGEAEFSFLRETSRYYSFESTLEALEIVYSIMKKRQSGEDTCRSSVTLVWDEYVANMLAILVQDKKTAEKSMKKVSEILMLGRSLGVRLVVVCQRPDAAAFPTGARVNFGIVFIFGAVIESIYSMLLTKEQIKVAAERTLTTGEGVMVLQSTELQFIKVPIINNEYKLQSLCIESLS